MSESHIKMTSQELQGLLDWCNAEPTEQEILDCIAHHLKHGVTDSNASGDIKRYKAIIAIKLGKDIDRDIFRMWYTAGFP